MKSYVIFGGIDGFENWHKRSSQNVNMVVGLVSGVYMRSVRRHSYKAAGGWAKFSRSSLASCG